MPKKANLENHLNVHELKQKYKISQDTVEARRWHLLWKIALGWTIKDSAIVNTVQLRAMQCLKQ